MSDADDALTFLRAEYDYLIRMLSSPPPGWYVLGTHIDPDTGKALDVELEFWGDDGGVPFWERPKPPTDERCTKADN